MSSMSPYDDDASGRAGGTLLRTTAPITALLFLAVWAGFACTAMAEGSPDLLGVQAPSLRSAEGVPDLSAGEPSPDPGGYDPIDTFDRRHSEPGASPGTPETSSLDGGSGSDLMEDAESPDGRRGWRRIVAGDRVIQKIPPGAVDESSVKSWRNRSGQVIAVTYVDKLYQGYRCNGYMTDIPAGAEIVEVLDEDGEVKVVWKDKQGETRAVTVPSVPSMSGPVDFSSDTMRHSSPYQRPDRGGEGQPGSQTGGEEATGETGGGTRTHIDPTCPVDDRDGSWGHRRGDADGSRPGSHAGSDAGTGSDSGARTADESTASPLSESDDGHGPRQEAHVPEPPPVSEPGNSFGFDPVLDDAAVLAIAEEEISRIRSGSAKNGLSMNEWGVMVGRSGTAVITHSAGIDGYPTPAHYWIANNASVQARIREAAAQVRTRLEEERRLRYERALADAGGLGAGTASSISAGSSVGPVSPGNYMTR